MAVIAKVGLGDGSTLPVGTPIPWPASTAPAGWIKCNGSTFTAAQYPKLALAYPGLVLPDLRGQFIRGWDDGKNIDTGRTLLSTQTDALQAITGTVNLAGTSLTQGIAFNASGAFTTGALTESTFSASNVNPNTRSNTLNFSAANVARTATETRPVNIAFNYIVRAA
ncbi:phage tail protein [Citrobacter amalonaticus]|uniref:phage tail protein n=1 Tax=Citrobacter amalonaticus TaxID=35703 RepID=UPI0018A948C9|nr:phage tail protein [Citrobacter amalonaticus]